MRFFFIPLYLYLTLCGPVSEAAPDESPQQLFKEGLSRAAQQQWSAAVDRFEKARQKNPHDPALLHNLALALFQDGQRARALGFWRQSLYQNPFFSPSQKGLSKAKREMDFPKPSFSPWLTFREKVLLPLPFSIYIFLFVLSFFFAAWKGLTRLGDLRRAHMDGEDIPPGFPPLLALALCFFLLTTGLLSAKFWYSLTPRATVVQNSSFLKSGPHKNSPEITDLFGGLEVSVHEWHLPWVLVQKPDGTRGWIHRKDLIFNARKTPWSI